MRGRVDGLLVTTPDLDGAALAEILPRGIPVALVSRDALGARAANLLLGRGAAARPPPGAARRALLPAELVTRASTAPPPSRASAGPGPSRSTRFPIPETAS